MRSTNQGAGKRRVIPGNAQANCAFQSCTGFIGVTAGADNPLAQRNPASPP